MIEQLRETEAARQAAKRQEFLFELSGLGFVFKNQKFDGTHFENERLEMVWQVWQAAKADAVQKLDKPAQVGAVRFKTGINYQTVIECAQRHYEHMQEHEPERIANAKSRINQLKTELSVPDGFVIVPKGLIKTLHEELLDHEPDSFVVIRDICELWRQVEAQEIKDANN